MITLTELRKRKFEDGILYLSKKEFEEYIDIVCTMSERVILGWLGIYKEEDFAKANVEKAKKEILKKGEGWLCGNKVRIRK